MPESELLQIDYYFRKERLSDDGGERAHARIVEALPEAKAGGLLVTSESWNTPRLSRHRRKSWPSWRVFGNFQW